MQEITTKDQCVDRSILDEESGMAKKWTERRHTTAWIHPVGIIMVLPSVNSTLTTPSHISPNQILFWILVPDLDEKHKLRSPF